jgi:hypothetical protein
MASAFASMSRRALRYLKPPRTDGARNGGVVSSIHARANRARSASGMGFHANVSSLAGQVGWASHPMMRVSGVSKDRLSRVATA